MSALPRFGSALTALALVSVVTGCASPFSKQRSASASKSNAAPATMAHAAIARGDFTAAVGLAESAVESHPNDDTIRLLLGNAYFGAGRFASAEAAYRDSLALSPNQPRVFLKLALVQIAQGQTGEALAFLNVVRNALDPADYGLALALAGQPDEAVRVLEPAARGLAADARVRQNLALAYGLSGDWTAARTIAAQDLPPDLVDSRVEQWMTLATPARPSDQVAALVGVTPAAADPGQPLHLALRGSDERLARIVPQAAPTAAPQPVAMPAATAHAAPVKAPAMTPAPMDFAPAEVVPTAAVQPEAPATAVAEAAPADPVFVSPPVPTVIAAPVLPEAAPPPPLVAALSPTIAPAPKRPAAAPRGNAGVVVQLGAYSSASRVETAWDQISDRFSAVREYTPTSARFDSDKGAVYRLSVKGFASIREASDLCASLKRQGKACFVRNVAGDTPVQFASR